MMTLARFVVLLLCPLVLLPGAARGHARSGHGRHRSGTRSAALQRPADGVPGMPGNTDDKAILPAEKDDEESTQKHFSGGTSSALPPTDQHSFAVEHASAVRMAGQQPPTLPLYLTFRVLLI